MMPTQALTYIEDIQTRQSLLTCTRLKKATLPAAAYFAHFAIPAAIFSSYIARHGWMQTAVNVYSSLPSLGTRGYLAIGALAANETLLDRTITKRILPFIVLGTAFLYHKWAKSVEELILSYYKAHEDDLLSKIGNDQKGLNKFLIRYFDSHANLLDEEYKEVKETFKKRYHFTNRVQNALHETIELSSLLEKQGLSKNAIDTATLRLKQSCLRILKENSFEPKDDAWNTNLLAKLFIPSFGTDKEKTIGFYDGIAKHLTGSLKGCRRSKKRLLELKKTAQKIIAKLPAIHAEIQKNEIPYFHSAQATEKLTHALLAIKRHK